MSNYINVFGYSLWIPSLSNQGNTEPIPRAPIYSPLAIALHTLVFGPFFGLILYGLNLTRRGEQRRGQAFMWGATALIALSLVSFPANLSGLVVLSGLVALTLYQLEKPHFDHAMLHGAHKALWLWPTMAGIALLILHGALAWLRL